MRDDEIKEIAVVLQETYPRSYLRKNEENLIRALRLHLAPYNAAEVMMVIREYGKKYDTAPEILTIAKLIKDPRSGKKPIQAKFRTFEDNEGFIYTYDDEGYIGECIWKPFWSERGKSKMAELKRHGVINY